MDHSQMDHAGMDHSGMGHGDMDMDMCSMSMLFTWDTKNLCIIFRQWHIRSTSGLLMSLLAIVIITAGYEALRDASRRYEKSVARRQEAVPRQNQAAVAKTAKTMKALLYAFQNFYAFMLMLLFMTYNGWVMVAMFIGSFVGYIAFGGETSSVKETACH